MPEFHQSNARLLERTGIDAFSLQVYENDDFRWLQHANGTLQSAMDRHAPQRLVLPYTAAMMAALLFMTAPRRVLMLGLGGASQLRFLRCHFPDVHLTVCEPDAGVITLARRHFALPDADESLRLIHADAETALADHALQADLILMDLFSAHGLEPRVLEPGLHDHCRQSLAPGGVLAANLWVAPDDESLRVMAGLQQAFAQRSLVLTLPGYHNMIVLGFNGTPCLEFAPLSERAADLELRTGLDFEHMLNGLRQSNRSDETGFIF